MLTLFGVDLFVYDITLIYSASRYVYTDVITDVYKESDWAPEPSDVTKANPVVQVSEYGVMLAVCFLQFC